MRDLINSSPILIVMRLFDKLLSWKDKLRGTFGIISALGLWKAFVNLFQSIYNWEKLHLNDFVKELLNFVFNYCIIVDF